MPCFHETSWLAVCSEMLRTDHSHSQFKIRTVFLWSLMPFFVLTVPKQDAKIINKSFDFLAFRYIYMYPVPTCSIVAKLNLSVNLNTAGFRFCAQYMICLLHWFTHSLLLLSNGIRILW